MRVMMILLSGILFLSCTNNNTSESDQQEYLISASKFKEKMKEDNVVVLDVRTPGEILEGVIGSPTIINFQDEDFETQIAELDKSKTYLVYCKSGGRSGKTKGLMDAQGFKEVYDLKGGITSWKNVGLPIN